MGICTQRCLYARESIEKIGQANVTEASLLAFMKDYPSNNKYSIYNTIMKPSMSLKKSLYETSLIENDGDAII
jgi:hypothetical protein